MFGYLDLIFEYIMSFFAIQKEKIYKEKIKNSLPSSVLLFQIQAGCDLFFAELLQPQSRLKVH